MVRTFWNLKVGLLVSIAGGHPYLHKEKGRILDLPLGNIVVSSADGTSGGVMQYDQSRQNANSGFELKGTLN